MERTVCGLQNYEVDWQMGVGGDCKIMRRIQKWVAEIRIRWGTIVASHLKGREVGNFSSSCRLHFEYEKSSDVRIMMV
jgi:hypothetical protein